MSTEVIPYTVHPREDTRLFNAKVGIWLFLASEVMLFGALFSSYIMLRVSAAHPTTSLALAFVSYEPCDMRLNRRDLLNELLHFFEFPHMRAAFRTSFKRHNNRFVYFFRLGAKASQMPGLAAWFFRLLLAFVFWNPERSRLTKRGSLQGFKPLVELVDLLF